MGRQFADVSSGYGAPMGRREYAEDFTCRCRCFRVRMVDGAYDDGGAYWGCANYLHGVFPLYAVVSEYVQLFIRARSRNEAKAIARARYQDIKWVN